MASRRQLHEELVNILGSNNVYFAPPESVKMRYPCIVYTRFVPDSKYANDSLYASTDRYGITLIGHDPENPLIDVIRHRFKMCRYDRHFTSENLYHDVFELYY